MKTTMHLAAQYLATAAISFIDKKEDDSHTNLGWVNHTLETHEFPNGDKLGLNYESFSLEWLRPDGSKKELHLDQTTHKEIKDWISENSSRYGIKKTYRYQLHYELPYHTVTDESRYQLKSREDLQTLIEQRDLAQQVFSSVLRTNAFESPIRIWTHHFDTGAFVVVHDNLSIGMGMAIPDDLINNFYFYISGYQGHANIDVKVSNLAIKDDYYKKGYQGFAKSINGLSEPSAIEFCEAAIDAYLHSGS